MNISVELLSMSLEPHIDENQIIRSLSHWSRKPFIGDRQNYEPQG